LQKIEQTLFRTQIQDITFSRKMPLLGLNTPNVGQVEVNPALSACAALTQAKAPFAPFCGQPAKTHAELRG
jgi:hypothetical protein